VRKVQVSWPIVNVSELQYGKLCRSDNPRDCIPKLSVADPYLPLVFIFFDPDLYRECYSKLEGLVNMGFVALKRGLVVALSHIVLNPNVRYIVCIGQSVRGLQRLLYDAWKSQNYTLISERLDKLNDQLRRQILGVIVLDNFTEQGTVHYHEVVIGSQSLRVPENVQVEGKRLLIVQPLPRAALADVLLAIQAVAIQEEPWTLVVKTFDRAEEYILYDPGAVDEPEPEVLEYARQTVLSLRVEEVQKRAEEISKTVLEVAPASTATASAESVKVEEVFGDVLDLFLKPRKVIQTDKLIYYDHGYLKIVITDDVSDAYRLLVREILDTGLDVPTRHGLTRETITFIVYRKFPRIELEIRPCRRIRRGESGVEITRAREEVIVKFLEPPSDDVLTQSDIELGDLKQYIEDLLSGRVDFDAKYNYGERLRSFGLELPKTYYRKGRAVAETDGQKQVVEMLVKFYEPVDKIEDNEFRKVLLQVLAIVEVDQLEEIVKTLLKDESARYALCCMWNSMVDTTRLVDDQPCWILLQFLVRRLGGKKRLIVLSYCRSHDFAGAHIANIYGVVFGVTTYVAEKLRRADPERFRDLEPGPGILLIASNHVYV